MSEKGYNTSAVRGNSWYRWVITCAGSEGVGAFAAAVFFCFTIKFYIFFLGDATSKIDKNSCVLLLIL